MILVSRVAAALLLGRVERPISRHDPRSTSAWMRWPGSKNVVWFAAKVYFSSSCFFWLRPRCPTCGMTSSCGSMEGDVAIAPATSC